MRADLAEIVCCPVHKTRLALHVDERDPAGDILRGRFHCDTCRFDYPIEDGIPNLLPPEYHIEEVKEKSLPADGKRRRGKPKAD